jgi:hypothetical protein
MTVSLPAPPGRARRSYEAGPLLAVAGVLACVILGLSVGVPTSDQRLLGAGVFGVLASAVALLWPFAALQVMLASSLVLLAWVVTGQRAVNPIDLLTLPVLAASLFGGARARARAEDIAGGPKADDSLLFATQLLVRSVLAFFGVAVFSLAVQGLRGHAAEAIDSALTLSRGLQGVMFFALGIWWLRTDRDIRSAERALQAGGWVLVIINTWFLITAGIARAGMTWIVNLPEWPMTSPNEAAISLLILWAVLQARPESRRNPMRLLLLGATLAMLVMTQSRSGLLAWLTYNLLTIRWRNMKSVVAVAAVMGSLAMMAPEAYWNRLARTLQLGGGSFEAFSSMVRVYGWQVAWRVFADHPILGVGYLGFRFVSSGYNDYRIVFNTTESYFLEVATGMGIVGLVALAVALRALWKVGPAVLAVAPAGSHAHEMARRHRPLIAALLLANLTANNFVGLTGLSQVAIWTALLIRAGHLSAVARRTAPGVPVPSSNA